MSRLTIRSKRGLTAAMATVLVASLSGCFLLPTDRPGVGSDVEPTADGAFAEYFAQELNWRDCAGGLECADMDVPIDWDDASSESVTIALARQSAGGTAAGSIFVNPGGPGGSGIDFVSFAVSFELAESFDVVSWDPRGVGQSTPVRCYDGTERDEMLYGTFDNPYFSEGWTAELEADADGYARACEANTGELLGHLDTVSTAHDLELMRALVTGDEPLNYLGYSYGTYIGAMYAELFPERVGRLVLDGAVDPLLNAFDELVVQMAGFESGFRSYMEDCLESTACPFAGTLATGLAQAEELIASVDDRNLVSTDGRELDSATVGTGIAMALYSDDYWVYLTELFDGLITGDADPSFFLADVYNDRQADGSYGSNSNDVYVTTVCVDNDFGSDSVSLLDRLEEIDRAAPTIGKYLALDDYALLDAVCDDWPFPPADSPREYDAEGAAPILVIGTSNDTATPYAWAESLAEQLDSGVLISVEGEGHTAYNGDNACVDAVVDSYFIDGTVPASDPRC